MPITVRHGPSPGLAGAVGYQAGLGQYQERALERALDEQDRLRQLELARQQMAQEIAEAERDRQHHTELQEQRYDLMGQRDQAQFGFQSDMQAVEETGEAVGEAEEFIAQQQFTPQGQLLQGDLLGKLQAIRRQRTDIPPDQYQKLMSQWLQEAEQSGIRRHVRKEPTLDELAGIEGIGPNGEVKISQQGGKRMRMLPNGQAIIAQPDGRIDIRMWDQRLQESDSDSSPMANVRAQNPMARYLDDDGRPDYDTYEKHYDKIADQLQKRRESQAASEGRTSFEPVKPEEVHQEIRERAKRAQQFFQGDSEDHGFDFGIREDDHPTRNVPTVDGVPVGTQAPQAAGPPAPQGGGGIDEGLVREAVAFMDQFEGQISGLDDIKDPKVRRQAELATSIIRDTEEKLGDGSFSWVTKESVRNRQEQGSPQGKRLSRQRGGKQPERPDREDGPLPGLGGGDLDQMEIDKQVEAGQLPPAMHSKAPEDKPGVVIPGVKEEVSQVKKVLNDLDDHPEVSSALRKFPSIAKEAVGELRQLLTDHVSHLERSGVGLTDVQKTARMAELKRFISELANKPRHQPKPERSGRFPGGYGNL